jgi:hypothetical protein
MLVLMGLNILVDFIAGNSLIFFFLFRLSWCFTRHYTYSCEIKLVDGIPLSHCRFRLMVFNSTFNNISVISWLSVLLVEETGVPWENHRPVASHFVCGLFFLLYYLLWSELRYKNSLMLSLSDYKKPLNIISDWITCSWEIRKPSNILPVAYQLCLVSVHDV